MSMASCKSRQGALFYDLRHDLLSKKLDKEKLSGKLTIWISQALENCAVKSISDKTSSVKKLQNASRLTC